MDGLKDRLCQYEQFVILITEVLLKAWNSAFWAHLAWGGFPLK